MKKERMEQLTIRVTKKQKLKIFKRALKEGRETKIKVSESEVIRKLIDTL